MEGTGEEEHFPAKRMGWGCTQRGVVVRSGGCLVSGRSSSFFITNHQIEESFLLQVFRSLPESNLSFTLGWIAVEEGVVFACDGVVDGFHLSTSRWFFRLTKKV